MARLLIASAEPEKDALGFIMAMAKSKPFVSTETRLNLLDRYHSIFEASSCMVHLYNNQSLTLLWKQVKKGATFFDSTSIGLRRSSEYDLTALHQIAKDKKPAAEDVKYWGGAAKPWRNGTTDGEITDVAVIEREERMKSNAEAEDAEANEDADSLRCRGISVTFLLQLTHELNIWDWETWQVVQFMVKPATAASRCRFADLDYIKPHTGPSRVFMSHCWSGKWGDLVCAACSGARTDRFVWIDIFAVRQWPGNGADLNFRGVIAKCNAVIVSFAPLHIPDLRAEDAKKKYQESQEYQFAARLLPFLRLWCIGNNIFDFL